MLQRQQPHSARCPDVGLGHGTHAVAQEHLPFLIDLNTRTVTQLERLEGGTTVPRALNDVGRVVGYYFPSGQGLNHGFITGPDGMGMRDLSLAGSSIYDDAADINEAAQVVGNSTPTSSSKTAFITGSNGESIRDLGSLGEDVSIARASSCRLSSDRFIARRKKMDGEAISLG
ncbi:hypothetical protein [Nitrosospira sp. Nsp14]|uniref:hypothetical protein n=1 Tax=Nitrosospira sp. Nsp14 TaxID=1855333 RepID=UPI00116010FB|nr:hypothetical protein [Nitrosospira sp. Nsp14]